MSTFDLSFRPDTYWPDSLTPEQLLSQIHGIERQAIARRLYAEFGFTALSDFLVKGAGAEVLRGDLRSPDQWVAAVQEVDAGSGDSTQLSNRIGKSSIRQVHALAALVQTA